MEQTAARNALSSGAAVEEARVVCYAHRGARAHAPENTLLAFALAFDLGADAIECDVQRSRDGQLVVIHDGTLNRTTNGRGLVAAHDLATLRALDAGRVWRLPQPIPTLDETLGLVRERGGAINIEIKGESAEEAVGTAEAVVPVLEALAPVLRPRLLASSFDLPAVALLKQRLPWLRVAALFGGRARSRTPARDLIAPALDLGAEAIHPGLNLVTPRLLAEAHTAGLRVNVWTVNAPVNIRRLIGWGVDGIFSDYPERVVIARALCRPDWSVGERLAESVLSE